ncbi:MAG: pyridoxal-dependent decarboxylase [Lachnospiraceae bacterium]|nr:pyridoxal-dependent decarboxylase [Lachnospiraceae bacterium]
MNTPCYVIRKKELESNIHLFKKALDTHWGNNNTLAYSVKTNSFPWILKFMLDAGCHAEIVSADEYDLVEKIGFSKGNIIFNGPIKTREYFFKALRSGNIVNLDSERELVWLEEYDGADVINVGLRVNFDLEAACPGDTVSGSDGGRFGYCYENGALSDAISRIRQLNNVRISGLHMHVSTYTRTLNVYRTVADMACRIKDEFGLSLDFIDMGGGFYGGLPDKPSYAEYAEAMASSLKSSFDPDVTRLIIEPGASVICGPIDLVTSVLDVKDTNRNRFVITDGSRIYIDPHMKMSSYFYDFELGSDDARALFRGEQVVCGMTCVESDRLIRLSDSPELRPGDRVIYHKAGSYTMCYSPIFIQYLPDVYVEEEGNLFRVREKWSADEYVQKCSW